MTYTKYYDSTSNEHLVGKNVVTGQRKEGFQP